MKIAKSIEYAATPLEVFAVLSDVKFQEAKCAATAAVKHSAGVETVGDHTVITTERILPSDGLPDFAKSMVGPTLKVTETQDWGPAGADGSRRGTVSMAVAGAPIALTDPAWRVDAASDRVGVRLDGPMLTRAAGFEGRELPSEGVVRGAVQLPADGRPVLFLADHPVTGGYPVVGVLTSRSADAAAQLVPGQGVRLRQVSSRSRR